MAGQQVVRLTRDEKRGFTGRELLATDMGRIRDVRQGPDGFLYLLTDEDAGMVLRIEPAN
jgi:glucose/arabinose dehydrogenase